MSTESVTAVTMPETGRDQEDRRLAARQGRLGLVPGRRLEQHVQPGARPGLSRSAQPFWLAYSWYDDVGTVHETRVGPRASVSLGRRRQLGVTLPAVPAGGADDPDKLNLYMLAAAADPGAGSGTMKLQSTTTATQLTLTSYNAAGAADPASNNFPGGTPAKIRSQLQAPGWTLRGDGSLAFGGTSFPASPSDGDSCYRTDLGMWFAYASAVGKWLSQVMPVTLAAQQIGTFSAAGPVGRW